MEPTLPLSQPPNQQEPSESSEPTSPIVIIPSIPITSTQPVSNLKLSVYSVDPFTNQFQPLTGIDWSGEGPILPGQSRNSSRVYFRNEGDLPVTLYLSASGWIFEDSVGRVLAQDYQRYFSLSWDLWQFHSSCERDETHNVHADNFSRYNGCCEVLVWDSRDFNLLTMRCLRTSFSAKLLFLSCPTRKKQKTCFYSSPCGKPILRK